ncbi:DUF6171 family protein [Paenibacillus turpanensis]|uniref:DUF6171 family protein n=1 Tax=Paenibacillus turpanensis TaxID=2689078 RepID=UPI00140AE36E
MNERGLWTERQGCKGCDDRYRVTDQSIARLVAAVDMDPENCVPGEEYERRLAVCESCMKLSDGITCSVCGCIIRVRAKLRSRGCPNPSGDLWRPAIAE